MDVSNADWSSVYYYQRLEMGIELCYFSHFKEQFMPGEGDTTVDIECLYSQDLSTY